jgi:hypothetical protein
MSSKRPSKFIKEILNSAVKKKKYIITSFLYFRRFSFGYGRLCRRLWLNKKRIYLDLKGEEFVCNLGLSEFCWKHQILIFLSNNKPITWCFLCWLPDFGAFKVHVMPATTYNYSVNYFRFKLYMPVPRDEELGPSPELAPGLYIAL